MRLSSIAMRIDRNEIWNNISFYLKNIYVYQANAFFPSSLLERGGLANRNFFALKRVKYLQTSSTSISQPNWSMNVRRLLFRAPHCTPSEEEKKCHFAFRHACMYDNLMRSNAVYSHWSSVDGALSSLTYIRFMRSCTVYIRSIKLKAIAVIDLFIFPPLLFYQLILRALNVCFSCREILRQP